ncbi:hypothetical protein ACFT2C_24040 [Promicromonospora sp. NPDC057138]|uniref:hypothetical protein n=1 Tax=Promicromonospora sp. NPDC057138 TaxID=3346031 RepID=UPI00362A9305
MSLDWGAINQIADNLIIAVGIAVLIVRQFLWRSAVLHRMLRLPSLVIAAGVGYLGVELGTGFQWVPGDWFIIGELALVAITGTAMGYVTRFRAVETRLEYRLTGPGVGLWAVFVAIRAGFFLLATASGADLAGATGLVLLSFGVNRLAAIMVVRRRAAAMLARRPESVSS